MKLGLKFILVALVGLAANVSLATPVYTGPTDGTSFGTNSNGTPAGVAANPAANDTGYYIWSTSATDWSIRWTGKDGNGGSAVWDFFGSIQVLENDLASVTEISFDNGQIDNSGQITFGGFDVLTWTAIAGNGWDGLDFTLNGDSLVIGFDLGSTYFDSLFDGTHECLSCASMGIFIGEGFAQPSVLNDYNDSTGHTYQRFQVAIPEPGTLALLGLGLAGLGFSRRKAVK